MSREIKHNISQTEKVNKIQSNDLEFYRFCVSDDRVNRNGWKILTEGIQTKNYLDNPVFLLNHNTNIVLGIAKNVFTEDGKLYADFWFHCESEESRLYKKLVDIGVFRMTSIGASVLKRGTPIPIQPEDKDKYGYWRDSIEVFNETDLMEISLVTIPANTGAKIKEKLKNAFESGIISNEDLILLNSYTYEDNYTENNNLINKSGDFSMNLEEAMKMIGTLQNENSNLSKVNSELSNKSQGLEQSMSELKNTTDTLKNEKTTLEQEITTLKNTLTELDSAKATLANQVIEAEVEAELAKLAEFILPAENNETNNFKLKRDLIHLKKNETSLVDADGKTLFEIKVNEIKSRKSNSYLTTPTPAIANGTSIDFKQLDYTNDEHRQLLANEALRLSLENSTDFKTELDKLMGEN